MPNHSITTATRPSPYQNNSICFSDDLDDRLVEPGVLESIALELRGPPNRGGSQAEYRWGSKGSASLVIAGPKRGSFYCHEAGEGGGMLAFIAHARDCSIADAARWVRERLGGGGQPIRSSNVERQARARDLAERGRLASIKGAADRGRRIAYAGRLWRESVRIDGTTGEKYLTATRAIPRPEAGWPNCLRFHPDSHSLVAVATLGDGAVRAVQRVRLTGDAEKAPHSAEFPTKVTNGVLDGAAVRLPGNPAGPLLVAEGPETGISVWAATGYETWITLGSMVGFSPPLERQIVICRDDDAACSPADRKLRKAVKLLRETGMNLTIASPWPERRNDTSDFNNVIQLGGVSAVRSRIEECLNPVACPTKRYSIEEARTAVGGAVADFFKAAIEYDPVNGAAVPVHAVKVGVAIGKSAAARQGAVDMLTKMRAAGDNRTIVFAVPTHALGGEAASDLEGMLQAGVGGLAVRVWRGRKANDPDAAGHTMCRDHDRVSDAQAAGQDVQTSCCAAKVLANGEIASDSILCPFYGVCGYQVQRRQKADIWVVAHEMLFTKKPAAIGDAAAVIVDESAWQDGLEGASGHPITLALDSLSVDDDVPGGGQRLQCIRSMAVEGLRNAEDGPVRRESMRAVGITPQNAAEARALEWRRKIDAHMHPGMTLEERKAAVKLAASNRMVSRFSAAWRAFETLVEDDGPDASGWAALAWADTKNGRVRVLQLKGRRPITTGWLVPTLLLDATMNIDLVRHHWPQATLTAEVVAHEPHQRVWQVADRSNSKGWLEIHDDLRDDDKRLRTRHLREIVGICAKIARSHAPGRTLLVAQKPVREALSKVGILPPSVDLAHHNAVAGRNEWAESAALVVVGRCAPSPVAVERIAEALTGHAVVALKGWYPKVATVREMASGESVAAECDKHPDTICEAVRWQICEGELIQIIGRGRGVNRTASNPLDVFVMTDVPLPIPLVGIIEAAEVAPSLADMMLGLGGIALENPTDAAEAYPELGNREALKKAMSRAGAERLGTFPYNRFPIRECPQPPTGAAALRRVEYQRSGPGRSRSVASCDPAIVDDPEAWLVGRLGKLAWCRPASLESDSAIKPAPTFRLVDDAPTAASGAFPSVPQTVVLPLVAPRHFIFLLSERTAPTMTRLAA